VRRWVSCLLAGAAASAGCLSTPGAADPRIDSGVDGGVDAPGADAAMLDEDGCVSGFPGALEDAQIVAGTGRLALAAGEMSGRYISPIYDGGGIRRWAELSWTTVAPSLKPLPDDAAIETDYIDGVDMTGNTLLLHLDDEEGTSFADGSGADNTGTCIGASCPDHVAPGAFGGARSFDGTSAQRIEIESNASIEPDQVSFEAWARRDGVHGGGGAFSAGNVMSRGFNTGQPYSSYTIEQVEVHGGQPQGALRCYIGIDADSSLQLVGDEIPQGLFHVACTYDGDQLSLYVNGELDTFAELTEPIAYDGLLATALTVGTWGTNNQQFNGLIDEVAVYGRTLEPAEIRRHYLRGTLAVRLQIRACDDPACEGDEFVGPDGTGATYYTEACNPALGPPRSLSPSDIDCDGDGEEDDGIERALADARYVQVRIELASAASGRSPEVIDLSLCPADE
jgi:hypothetical protein